MSRKRIRSAETVGQHRRSRSSRERDSDGAKVQVIRDPGGAPAYAVLPWERYEALREATEDAADSAAAERALARLEAGEAQLVPARVVDSIDEGEHPIRAFRTWRGLTQAELARAANLQQGYVSELESGAKSPSLESARALARALDVDLELLLPPED